MDFLDNSPTEDLNILSQGSYNRLLRDFPITEQWSAILNDDEADRFQDTTVEYSHFAVNEELHHIGTSAGAYTQLKCPPRPPLHIEEPEPAPSSPVVITEPFEGEYGFFISCGEQEKRKKSTPWAYASERRKLFVNINVVCPFHVHVKRDPPAGSTLRVMAVYAQSNFAMDIVKCCPLHGAADREGDKHLIRCESPWGAYVEDPVTNRHSVVSPFLKAEVGTAYSVYLYRFMCLSSCSGGMNRRPIKVVFTLEHGGSILGRFSMDVKICACPGRDRDIEDKKLKGKGTNDATNDQVKRGAPVEANFMSVVPTKRTRTSDDEDYTVKCNDKNTYHLLTAIRKWTEAFKCGDEPSSGNQPPQSLPLLTQLVNASLQEKSGTSQSCNGSATEMEKASQTSPTDPSTLAADLEEAVHLKSEVETQNVHSRSTPIEDWLASLNMSSCCRELQEKGYTTLDSLRSMTLEEAKRLKLTRDEKNKLFGSFLSAEIDDSDEEEFVSVSQRCNAGYIPTSQESNPGGLSQHSHASSSGSAKSFTVTHVRIRTRIKNEHNYS
ncbi:cellular tumor antigen p53-like isoform X2 [Ornithodoros turicata]